MLASALHPDRVGALRASIAAEYPGLPTLRTILTGRTDVNALDLADYVANLPLGCALLRAEGGPAAWSNEMHLLAGALHALDLLVWQNTGIMTRNPKGSQPKAVPYPDAPSVVKEAGERLDVKREKREARRASRAKLRATE